MVFGGKAGACPSETLFRCTTLRWAPGLAHKHVTRLERLARDKHFSLLGTFVNYGLKFITFTPGRNVARFFMAVIYKHSS